VHTSLAFTWHAHGLTRQAELRLRDFVVTMEAAAGSYLLKIRSSASHTDLVDGCPVLFEGDVRLEGGARPCLGLLQGGFDNGPLILRNFEQPVTWAVPVSYEALDAIERHRAGRDLTLAVSVHALLGGDRGDLEWPVALAQTTVTVPVGEWVRQLEQVNAAAGLFVVVHAPLHAGDSRRADAVGYLRTARRLLAGGDFDQAVAEARKVLDVLDQIAPVPDRGQVNNVVPKNRDKSLRWAGYRHATQDLINSSPHGDAIAAQITWTYEDAAAVLAAVAGLLNRL
jgi:hypothetical protein